VVSRRGPEITDPKKDARDNLFDVSGATVDIGRKTGRSAMSVLLYALLKLGVALGTTAILARLVPPAEHGLIALAVPAVMIATGLSDFGLAHAVTQMRHVTHNMVSALFWVNTALGSVLTLVVAGIGTYVWALGRSPEVAVVFWTLSPYVLFTVLTTQYIAMLRRQMRIAVIERIVFVATLTSSAGAIVLARLGYGIQGLIAQLLVQQFMTFLLLAHQTKWRPSGPLVLRTTSIRSALSFGSFLAAERLLNNLIRNMQITLVGWLFGQTAAGLYYRADTIAVMPERRVVSPLSAAFLPTLSRLQDDLPQLREMLRRQNSRSNVLMVPVGALLAACPDLVVHILLGPNWAEAVPVLGWLGLPVITALTANLLIWTLVATAHARALFLFRLLGATIATVAIVAGIPLGFESMTAFYAITTGPINLGLLAVQVARTTRIGHQAILGCLGDLAGLAGVLLLPALALRLVMDSSMILETAVAGGWIALMTAAFVVFSPGLRADARRVLGRFS
jgi:O-antigen/teichoic acid export membrane protein